MLIADVLYFADIPISVGARTLISLPFIDYFDCRLGWQS